MGQLKRYGINRFGCSRSALQSSTATAAFAGNTPPHWFDAVTSPNLTAFVR